jgi:hypothetical protein
VAATWTSPPRVIDNYQNSELKFENADAIGRMPALAFCFDREHDSDAATSERFGKRFFGFRADPGEAATPDSPREAREKGRSRSSLIRCHKQGTKPCYQIMPFLANKNFAAPAKRFCRNSRRFAGILLRIFFAWKPADFVLSFWDGSALR